MVHKFLFYIKFLKRNFVFHVSLGAVMLVFTRVNTREKQSFAVRQLPKDSTSQKYYDAFACTPLNTTRRAGAAGSRASSASSRGGGSYRPKSHSCEPRGWGHARLLSTCLLFWTTYVRLLTGSKPCLSSRKTMRRSYKLWRRKCEHGTR